MLSRKITIGFGIIAVVGPMMWQPPWQVLLPFLLLGVGFICWGIFGDSFEASATRLSPHLGRLLRWTDECLNRLSINEASSVISREAFRLEELRYLSEKQTNEKTPPGPDFDAWDAHEKLTIFEAGCLWAGITPSPTLKEDGNHTPWVALLKKATAIGEIEVMLPLSLQLARTFAEIRGEIVEIPDSVAVSRARAYTFFGKERT